MLEAIFSQDESIDLPYIIAEISANHNGSIDRAIKTIKAAKNAGVDAVKIQTYTPETMTIDSNNSDFLIKKGLWKGRSLYNLYQEAYTPYEWHDRLFNYAKELDITLFSTPFDETAVDLLEKLNTPLYKVASFELVDLPLIRYIATKNKPIIMSTGMANLQEIGIAVETARSGGCDKIALLHCVSGYPASIKESNLSLIASLRKEFNIPIGLSDHTKGNTASIAATALGASFIEKHFTLSRSDGGVDSEFSLEPNEMKNLVNGCKDAFSALGDGTFMRTRSEKDNKIFRRSLYFVEDIKAGEMILPNQIRRIRPGFGISPRFYENVIGRRVTKNVSRGDRVVEDVIEVDLNKKD